MPGGQNTYLFADGVHPTTGADAIVAQFVEQLIEGPTAYSILPEAAMRTREGHVRTVNEGLLSGGRAEIGRVTVFAAGDRGTFDLDPSATSTNRSGSIGVTVRVSEGVTLGAAVGKSTSDGHLGDNMGGYHSSETVASLFGSGQWGNLYGTVIGSVANISFSDMSRTIILGPATRTATARPDGSNASLFATLGYDFPIGNFRIGPMVSVNSQSVDVNAFDEEGAGSANLHIGAQAKRSEVWSAGVRASMRMGAWEPWLRTTADTQRKDDVAFLSASPLSPMYAIGWPAFTFTPTAIPG